MARQGYGNTEGENILCPLFKNVTGNEIWCQSHIPECFYTVHRYRNNETCAKQKRIYCEENWQRCEHYLAWEHFRWTEE